MARLGFVRHILLDLLAPALFGGLATLGFAPFGWYGLALLALVGLIALWWRAAPKQAALRGFVFGLAHFGSGIYWTFVSMHYYGGAPLPMAVALVCLLTAYMALYPMLVGLAAGLMRRLPRPLWALVFVPAVWMLGELLRSWLMTGFPWLSLGYALINAPATALAPIGGVYFLGFLMMVAAGTVVLLFAGSLTGRAISVVLIALAPLILWSIPSASHWTQPTGEPIRVAIIQGNFAQELKWRRDTLAITLSRYRDLTRRSEADLVIWPEVAIPAPASRVTRYIESIDAMAAARGQTVLVGTLTQDTPDGPYYNTVLALGTGTGRYRKRHLVPFGEYFPVPDFVKGWLDAIEMRFSNLGFGAENQQPIVVDGVAVGTSICFEDGFAYELAKALPQAGFLINVTNDAWFAGTTAADQHLEIARMRALEAGRPMLRAANTGISALIGHEGRILDRTDQFAVATIESKVQPRKGSTPYTRMGDIPLWLAAIVLTALGLTASILRRRHDAA